MHRREFLAALGTSGGLAGCLGRSSPAGTPTASDPGEPPTGSASAQSSGTEATSTPEVDSETARHAVHGIPPDICEREISPDSGIYAITDPAFAGDWADHDVGYGYRHDRDVAGLVDEQTVLGLETGDGARAYPLTVLTPHEVVNDSVAPRATDSRTASGGVAGPVLVTYCPLCRSGMVARRRVRGKPTRFAVSGHLWKPERVYAAASEDAGRTFGASYSGGEEVSIRQNGNLVLYDAATHSYWSQILARGICGPETGTDMAILPSSVATWGEWRERHPNTEVLLPPPHSGTVEPGAILGSGSQNGGDPGDTPER